MIDQLIRANRTCRRFDEHVRVERLQLERWLSTVRLTASARNVQPLKYILVTIPEMCHYITAHQHWAGLLNDWEGPSEGERPTAYMIQLIDTRLSPSARFDEGIHLQTIGLLATEAHLAICPMQPHSTADLARLFELPAHLSVNCVIAVGKPAETRILEDARSSDDTKYWRDAQSAHHVPKRLLSDIIVEPNQRSLF